MKFLANVWVFYTLAFIFSFILSLLLTPVFKSIAEKLRIYDWPDEDRKIHHIPKPYLGGLAVVVAISISVFLSMQFHPEFFKMNMFQLKGIILSAVLLVIFGLYDDIKKMPPTVKLIGQVVVASILYYYKVRIEFITNPFGGRIWFGIVDRYLLSVLWIVFFMNAINLIDGIDGLASGVVFICGITFFGISLIKNSNFAAVLSIILAGALAGFLPYNLPPAKIFLGDVGSMFLGFFIAVVALVGTSAKISTIVALIVPVIILFIPVYDTLLAAMRRLMAAKYMFIPDREHLHHKLIKLGFSVKTIIFGIYLVTLIFSIISVFLVLLPKRFYGPVALLVIAFILFLGILFRALSARKSTPAK